MVDIEPDEYVKIAELSEIPENERLYLEIGGNPVVVINLSGKLYAFGDVCTHDNGPLGDGEVDEFQIKCPRHGALFDIRTGKSIRGPAFHDIPVYPVKIENDIVYIEIPKQSPD